MHLHLLIPELLWPEPEDGLAYQELGPATLPALSRLLDRCPPRRESALAPETWLAQALEGDRAPLAYRRWQGEGMAEGVGDRGLLDKTTVPQQNPIQVPSSRPILWLCADPAHLRLHQEQVVLADSRDLGLTPEEAQALGAALGEHFSQAGDLEVQCFTPHPRRWYLRLQGGWLDPVWQATQAPDGVSLAPAQDYPAPPLSAVTGRRLENLLPRSGGAPLARHLAALFNEAQMFLYAHPVNEAREARGQATVNSLWLWGAAWEPAIGPAQPADVSRPWNVLYSDDTLSRGLARSADVPVQALPDDYAGLASAAGTVLAQIPDLLPPAQYQEAEDWRQALLDLEQCWFAPLLTALDGGQLESLTLVSPSSYGLLSWTPAPRNPWRFWQAFRQPRGIQDLARTLAADRGEPR